MVNTVEARNAVATSAATPTGKPVEVQFAADDGRHFHLFLSLGTALRFASQLRRSMKRARRASATFHNPGHRQG